MGDGTVRERILSAALKTATVHGIARLSVGDVARTAGLSRQTVYKYFPSKDALIAAVVLNEASELVSQVVAAADAVDDPRSALEAAILAALVVTREHPLLDRLVRTEPETLLPLLSVDGGPVMGLVRPVVEEIVGRKLPDLSPVQTRRLADVITRLLVSYAIAAPDDPPEVVAASVAALLTGGVPSNLTAPARRPE
ncbi:MAG TPA: TetR/AcrR family transcriptional regulator [Acidimicrobiales bacterium]